MRWAILATLGAVLIGSCSVDPNEQANKLFVDAQKLIDKSKQESTSEERLRTLQAAHEKLNTIVREHPGANLAVQLTSGQAIGEISLKALSERIDGAKWDVCLSAPRRACLLARALSLGRTIKYATSRVAALADIARTQVKAGLTKDGAVTFAEALQVARSIDQRGTALATIARAQAEAGLIAEAIEVTRSITDEIPRARALTDIVRAQAQAGRFAEAIELARSIQNESWRVHPLAEVARAQVKAGLTQDGPFLVSQDGPLPGLDLPEAH